MDKKIVTKGICYRCKQLVTKNSAKSHINKCSSLGEANTVVDAFLVKVQWPHKNPIYWLYLAVPFKATLEDLDDFLRKTWLECCPHLSQFTINHKRFSSHFEPDTYSSIEQLPMSISSEKVLVPGLKFIHEYDFGSTTELLLDVVELIKIEATKEISIMIRNQEPEFECAYCDEKAVMICSNEDDFLCESCAGDEESFLPLSIHLAQEFVDMLGKRKGVEQAIDLSARTGVPLVIEENGKIKRITPKYKYVRAPV